MTTADTRRRRRAAGQRDAGSSTVELVITMPALLLVVLAILQFGIWAHAQHVALAAARDGAETARAYGGTDQAAQDRAAASLDRLGPTILRDPRIEVARAAEKVTVTVAGSATSILGLFRFPVHEQVHGTVERFVGAAR